MRVRCSLALVLAACAAPDADGPDDTDDTDDTEVADTDDTDAAADTADTDDTDVVPDVCEVDESYTDLEPEWQLGASSPSGLPNVATVLRPSGETAVDLLRIELYETGPFADGVVPGTYTFSGENGQYATCGVCVILFADFEESTNESERTLLATGGTIVLTEGIDGLVADLTDLVLEEVTIDEETFESTVVPDGCTTTIDTLSVEAWLREVTCNDFVDNDEDGVLDCGDPDCAAACD